MGGGGLALREAWLGGLMRLACPLIALLTHAAPPQIADVVAPAPILAPAPAAAVRGGGGGWGGSDVRDEMEKGLGGVG